MTNTELAFVPMPGLGHVASSVKLANELLNRNNQFSVTILVTNPPFHSEPGVGGRTSFQSLNAHQNVRFIDVPTPQELPPQELLSQSLERYLTEYMASHKSNVKDILINRFKKASLKLSGLILDLFCSAMVGLAEELEVPSYVFFTSGAAILGFMFHLHSHHARGGGVFKESDADLDVPSYANPVPPRVLPAFALSKTRGFDDFSKHGREFKRVNGIIVNTFLELEAHAGGAFADGVSPPIYHVGPLLDLNRAHDEDMNIMAWLDDQPDKSVVFLCFGSLGAFRSAQLREIAIGLEQSEQRFLWSVSKAADETEEFLPEGFTERTKGVGMLCGWAPQVAILAHRAVGGFVSHCGWNSILESLWFGVPMGAWPLYAEQQLNGFQLVMEMRVAVELMMDYRMESEIVVMADEVERSVRCLMERHSEVRAEAEEMSEKSRKAVVSGGSSFVSLGRLIDDIIANAT